MLPGLILAVCLFVAGLFELRVLAQGALWLPRPETQAQSMAKIRLFLLSSEIQEATTFICGQIKGISYTSAIILHKNNRPIYLY